MRLSHLSDCCQGFMFKKDNGLMCEDCGNMCKSIVAISHCCHAPIDYVSNGYPFSCSECEGDCEVGNPETPTHEDIVNAQILRLIRKHREGEIKEDEAWRSIVSLLRGEVRYNTKVVSQGILFEMEESLSISKSYDPSYQAFSSGVELALHKLRGICADLS